MKPLNIRFPDTAELKIKDVSDITDLNNSAIARAALNIGLRKLVEMSVLNVDETKEFIRIENIKAQL